MIQQENNFLSLSLVPITQLASPWDYPKGKAPAKLTNIKLGRKGLQGTTTQAYLANS